ncbi:MAG: PmoA family protein [Pirellulales bacterium]|nr:PmoA family protein [Pirellulales bacterium]
MKTSRVLDHFGRGSKRPFRSSWAATLATVFTVSLVSSASANAQVTLERAEDTLDIKIDGELFTTYRFSDSLPKPYFWPVRSVGGAVVTRPIKDPEDHPHHKGVWIAVDEVNGIKFWGEQGRIVNRELEILRPAGVTASFRATNQWEDRNGKAVLIETTTFTCSTSRLLSLDISLAPAGAEVTFEDTKEGLVGIRLPNGMREADAGRVFNADGLKTAARCWGQPSTWVNYAGPVNGETHGVALFDHPDNPHPGRYHVRDYGLFSVNPFGDRAYSNGKKDPSHVHLTSGESYRLRYALFVHAGAGEPAEINSVFGSWAGK